MNRIVPQAPSFDFLLLILMAGKAHLRPIRIPASDKSTDDRIVPDDSPITELQALLDAIGGETVKLFGTDLTTCVGKTEVGNTCSP